MKLKKGDTVLVIAGKDKGKTGTIEATVPSLNRVVVSGVNSYKKHVKASMQNPQGGIVELNRSINASNVMLLDAETNKPTRIGFTVDGTSKTRIARSTGKAVGK